MKTENLYQTKSECCGCGMCANACPSQIIHMKPDEIGFLYPVIVDETRCLSCEKCLKVCPIKNVGKEETEFIDFYAASYVSDADTISCSSGGLATAISNAFIRTGGVVYGAAYSDNYKNVKYIRVDNEDKLENLKGSKYAQADKGFIYKSILNDLKEGTKCLFIGLPCDVAAVVDYFKHNENLFTIELVCHGPTSADVQRQYCEALEKRFASRIVYFTNRYKKRGNWKPFYNYVQFETGKEFMEQFHKSSFGSAFRYLKRPSCYVCPIKDKALKGDLMIGDYHYVEKGMKGYNPHGVSSAMTHNDKGRELVALVENSIDVIQIPRKNALANGAIHHPIPSPKDAFKYREVYLNQGLNKAHGMLIVIKSNYKRTVKSTFLKVAVKIKRILRPSGRPNEH